jgi:hypothetical protein
MLEYGSLREQMTGVARAVYYKAELVEGELDPKSIKIRSIWEG